MLENISNFLYTSFTSLILTSCMKSLSSNLFSMFFISLFSLTVIYSTNSSFLLLYHLTGGEMFVYSVDSKHISTEKLNCRARVNQKTMGHNLEHQNS